MSVAVYGFQDGTYLYSAYKADITMAGWATACSLSINLNPYFKTPQSASWPDMGYTVFEMVYPRYMQTDGSDWDEVNAVSLPDGIVEYGFTDLYATTEAACLDGTGNNHMAEFKIPLSILTYAGADDQIRLFGQYWQYDFSDSFFVSLAPTCMPITGNEYVDGECCVVDMVYSDPSGIQNHGMYVSCVADAAKRGGLSGKDRGTVVSTAAKSGVNKP